MILKVPVYTLINLQKITLKMIGIEELMTIKKFKKVIFIYITVLLSFTMVACSDSNKELTTNTIEKDIREIKVNNSDKELKVEFFIKTEDVPEIGKWVHCFTNNS